MASSPVPLGTDWHDVKMQILWSASDTVGFIRLWLNGVRQTFLDGSDTYYVRDVGDTVSETNAASSGGSDTDMIARR